MNRLNKERFFILLEYVHSHANGSFTLYDNKGRCIEAEYDTDYESDNGLDEDDDGYEEFQCIAFKNKADGRLFEVNYHEIPVRVICDGITVY